MPDTCMKIVLVTPEIPHNTGAIGRTCVALDLELILIKPYGFSINDTTVMRAGTRYWKHVRLAQYDDWKSFLKDRKPARENLYFFEEHGAQSFYNPLNSQDCKSFVRHALQKNISFLVLVCDLLKNFSSRHIGLSEYASSNEFQLVLPLFH